MRLASFCTLVCCVWSCARSFELPDSPDSRITEDGGLADSCAIPSPSAGVPAVCPPSEHRPIVVVRGPIREDETWTCDHRYQIEGRVFVQGATLTIDAGVIVRFGDGATDRDALVVDSTARLEAVGSAASPIVFEEAPGGGIVLLGRAPVNAPESTGRVHGLPSDARGSYGGSDPGHDCGTLRYVRVEGSAASASRESAVTLAGCGAATEIDFLQVHGSAGAGLELRGGTAPLRHVVVSDASGEGIRWSQGWRGDAQFIVVRQGDGQEAIRGGSHEHDLGPDEGELRSSPHMWNLTLAGHPGGAPAIQFESGTRALVANALLVDFPRQCIRLTGAETVEEANDGALSLTSSLLHHCGGELFAVDEPDDASVTFTGAWATQNTFGQDPRLATPAHPTQPDFMPALDSVVSDIGAVPDEGFERAATFAGAIEPGCWDWTAGWTRYPSGPHDRR